MKIFRYKKPNEYPLGTNFNFQNCFEEIKLSGWRKMVDKIKRFFAAHPWDWVAHFLLGFFVLLINWALLTLVADSVALILSIWGAFNFLIAVELTQIDIFGIKKRLVDSLIDLLAGGVGLCLALFLI